MEESLYLLIPLSVVLVFAIALVFRWSVRSGQFDDMEGPAFRLLMDDDSAVSQGGASAAGKRHQHMDDAPPKQAAD
jgi:cbb3-type cytochrome oxidase maturation protein